MASPTTLISEGMRIRGRITGDGDVEVLGVIQGVVAIGGTLSVGPRAIVTAEVTASSVLVEGRIEGLVRATKQICIKDGGVLVGEVDGVLLVEDGGCFTPRKGPLPSSSAEPDTSRNSGFRRPLSPTERGPRPVPVSLAEGEAAAPRLLLSKRPLQLTSGDQRPAPPVLRLDQPTQKRETPPAELSKPLSPPTVPGLRRRDQPRDDGWPPTAPSSVVAPLSRRRAMPADPSTRAVPSDKEEAAAEPGEDLDDASR